MKDVRNKGMISETGSGTGLPDNVQRKKVPNLENMSYGEYPDSMQEIDKRIKKDKSRIKKNSDY